MQRVPSDQKKSSQWSENKYIEYTVAAAIAAAAIAACVYYYMQAFIHDRASKHSQWKS